MSQCFLITSKRNLQSSEPLYTACPDFYREDPTPKAFGGDVRLCAPRRRRTSLEKSGEAVYSIVLRFYLIVNEIFLPSPNSNIR